jgi:hypothetical protein
VHLRQGNGVHGRFTEWLGSGLQNRLRRFESATDLSKIPPRKRRDFYFSADTGLPDGGNKIKILKEPKAQGFC